MNLHEVIAIKKSSKKRVGRGLGSGKGKTSGRGTKGQKARGKVSLGFIGGTLPLYRKLPFRRGLGNPKRSVKMILIPLSQLNVFKDGSVVDLESLIQAGITKKGDAQKYGVKVVGGGELEKKLTVKLSATSSAIAKIEQVGGQIVNE